MKINLCCGMDYREGYINVDFSNLGSDGNPIKVDLVHDVTTRLPWPDEEIKEIVFRESLEHFNKLQGFEVLKEIYRVLEKGGKLDLTVPNAPRQLKTLIAHVSRPVTIEQFFNPHMPPWSYFKFHEDLLGATHLKSKGDSHLTLYTRPYLEMILKHLGFIIESFVEDSSFYVIARK